MVQHGFESFEKLSTIKTEFEISILINSWGFQSIYL